MLDWIRQALGSTVTLENGAGLSRTILEPLTDDLGRLKKFDAALPGKALAFVVDGRGGDVPRTITQAHRSSQQWTQMWSSHDQDLAARAVRWKLYDHWETVPPEIWVRFGQVLAATSPPLSQNPTLTIGASHPWIEALTTDLVGLPLSHYGKPDTNVGPHKAATMNHLEALLESVGLPKHELVVSSFFSFPRRGRWASYGRTAEFITSVGGFEVSAVREVDRVRAAFREAIFDNRLFALRLISGFGPEALSAFADELVSLSLDSSSQVRAAALPLALRAGGRALDLARGSALEQKPAQRARALELLWASQDSAARDFVKERATSDPAESVRQTVQSLDTAAVVIPVVVTAPKIEIDVERPLTEVTANALRQFFSTYNEHMREQRARAQEQWKKNWKELTGQQVDTIIEHVAHHPGDGRFDVHEVGTWTVWPKFAIGLNTWAQREDVTLAHVVRLLIACGWIRDGKRDRTPLLWGPACAVLSHFGRAPGRASLLELQKLLEVYDRPADLLDGIWFRTWAGRLADGWPDEAVWPYFAAHRELIDEALNPANPKRNDYAYDYSRVYDALATFPVVPADLFPRLFDLALGSNKTDRAGAQRVLDRLPDITNHLIKVLESGKAEVRAAAATWLARLKATHAVEPLEAALTKEKSDVAAAALMSALEHFGVPVARFLKREGLLEEALAGLKKGVPADIAWIPFDQLPPLAWADSGEVVPATVSQWWIVQSCKLRNPEPGGVLRHYFAALRPATRQAFALFVLQAWIRADVNPISRTEAEKLARAQAQQSAQMVKAYPQYYSDAQKNLTEDQFYEALLPSYLVRPAGSAIGAKGILAVVAAGGGSEIAPMVQRYLKEWYGTRAAQGKALIQMLAWVDHPTATQLMLSIGSRFRTKSFQEEATRQAERLAERRGWTVDELADRTIPTAGFDPDGTAEIDYGSRRFRAKLGPDFEIQLYSPEGKEIAALPDALKHEDEARVKEAKKSWSAARKELKGILQLQRNRLYEALCTERTWSAEDWQLYLHEHPIVGRYCERLVWSAAESSGKKFTFRPLEDRTLTDVNDEAIVLSPGSRVSLAHDGNLSESERSAWQQHLADYRVEPLFQQLGKGVYRLPDDRHDQTEIEDFLGHILDAFSLRGRASKLGYTRAAAEDGGWFFRYEKRFPTLGIEALIEFTGNGLPETNRKVALKSLSFTKRTVNDEHTVLALADVPRVLLSESWNDMRLMAAEGSGFDPDWQKKTES